MSAATVRKRRRRVPANITRTTSSKKVVIDFPASLFNETEWAVHELSMNRSHLIRHAVEQFLAELRKKNLEKELMAGYIANAAQVAKAAEAFAYVDADLT